MFIHAPFKDDIEGEDRNMTSIVVQLRFSSEREIRLPVFFWLATLNGVIKEIMDKTTDNDYLNWDLMEAPHHCSYKFFADARENDPNQASLDFLDKKESNAYVVSSSKIVKKNSDNPPCQKAKNRYTDKVGESNFLCTSGEKDDDTPTPIVFVIEDGEVGLLEDEKKEKEARAAAAAIKETKPHFYG